MESERERFYAAVADVLPAMGSIREALRIVSERGSAGARTWAATARLGVDAGLSLADSLERAPERPPSEEIALVRAGEESGTLVQRLEFLAAGLAARRERLRRILMRLAYPAFLFHLAVLVGTFATRAVGVKSSWVSAALVIALVDAAAITALVVAFSRRSVRGSLARTWLRIPVAGRIAALDDTERVTSVIGALYGAGRPLPLACRDAAGAARFEPHSNAIAAAAARLAAGEPAATAFAPCGFLERDVRDAIALAEPAGRLESGLVASAALAARRRDAWVEGAIRGVVGTAFVAAIAFVLWTVMSFYSSYFSALGAVPAPAPGSAPSVGRPSFFLM